MKSQAPQLAGSACVSTQAEPQTAGKLGGQAPHVPATQGAPARHAVAQLPQ